VAESAFARPVLAENSSSASDGEEYELQSTARPAKKKRAKMTPAARSPVVDRTKGIALNEDQLVYELGRLGDGAVATVYRSVDDFQRAEYGRGTSRS